MQQTDKAQQPSAEYQNFENALKQALTVSPEEMKRRLQADKDDRAKKRAAK